MTLPACFSVGRKKVDVSVKKHRFLLENRNGFGYNIQSVQLSLQKIGRAMLYGNTHEEGRR